MTPNPQTSTRILDRAIGTVVGCAIGDALGAGYEFTGPRDPASIEMLPGRLTSRPPGQWTDDTEMTLAVLMAQAGRFASPAEGFLAWYATSPPDVGNQTRSILSATTEPSAMAKVSEAFQQRNPDAAGNGSLMRTGTVALSHLGNSDAIIQSARETSALTHAHEDAQDACVLWSLAIDRGVRGVGTWRANMEFALEQLPIERVELWRERLADAERVTLDQLSPNGWVVAALQAAWRSIVASASDSGARHFEQGVRFAVSLGDDTDTVAAIAGAYLGAHYGASLMPFASREHLAGWPSGAEYELATLAALATSSFRPDASGWPNTPTLIPYYQSNFSPAGRLVSFPEAPEVQWGDVANLATHDRAATISLCRIGHLDRREAHAEFWLIDGDDNADVAWTIADAADTVERWRQTHGSLYVHCVRAESRTPAVAATWLTRHHGYSLESAWAYVAETMPWIQPNPALRNALTGN